MPRGRPRGSRKKKPPLWASKTFQFYLLIGVFALFFVLGVVRSVALPGGLGGDLTPRKGVYALEIGSPIVHMPEDSGNWLFGSKAHVSSWVGQIDRAAADPKILGLLLRINSPGGSVGASEELYAALVRFKQTGKKLVVSIVGLCASGAYYVSLPADLIVANQGSVVGSIGVITTSWDVSDLMRRFGVRMNVVKSSKNKDIMSPHRRMTQEERASLQRLVNEFHELFVERIVEWRGSATSKATVRRRANGQVYSAAKAKAYGFIDRIGDYNTAKEAIAELCELNPETLHIIKKENKLKSLVGIGAMFRQAVRQSLNNYGYGRVSVDYR